MVLHRIANPESLQKACVRSNRTSSAINKSIHRCIYARVVELADTLVLETGAFGYEGSSPSARTNFLSQCRLTKIISKYCL